MVVSQVRHAITMQVHLTGFFNAMDSVTLLDIHALISQKEHGSKTCTWNHFGDFPIQCPLTTLNSHLSVSGKQQYRL